MRPSHRCLATFRSEFYGLADAFLDDYADVIGDEIQRCFASDLQSLAGHRNRRPFLHSPVADW